MNASTNIRGAGRMAARPHDILDVLLPLGRFRGAVRLVVATIQLARDRQLFIVNEGAAS